MIERLELSVIALHLQGVMRSWRLTTDGQMANDLTNHAYVINLHENPQTTGSGELPYWGTRTLPHATLPALGGQKLLCSTLTLISLHLTIINMF